MTKKQHQRQQGFTLIEMIAVLILVGMMSAVAGLGIVKYVQGYLFAKDNAAISANAQLAIARISRELLECSEHCLPSSATTLNQVITLPFHYHHTILGIRYIRLSSINCNSGNCIQLSSDNVTYDTLLDNVGTFTMTYNVNMTDGGITVKITSSRKPWGITIDDPNDPKKYFVTKVYPRNSSL